MEYQIPDTIDWNSVMVIIIGTFMAILSGSSINVSLPVMMNIFGVTADSIQWVISAYMLTMGIMIPISGFLGDTFGYKRTYIVALFLFLGGSCLCGLAWNFQSLVAARVIQALGGGIMQPLGMAFIYRVAPRAKIGVVLGVWGIAAMAAPALGPMVGGYLVEYVNWRLIFYINLPIGAISLFLAGIHLKETPTKKITCFDYVGVATSSLGVFCLLMALSKGAREGWGSPYIVSLFLIAAVSLSVLIWNELKHPEPILELRIFKDPIFSASVGISTILNIGLMGAMFLLPLLIQDVLGQTAMKSGLITFPGALGMALMMPLSGRIFDKYGARAIGAVGIGITMVTTYAMSGFNENTSFHMMSFWIAARGLGMGLAMMPITTAGMNAIPLHLVARASSLGNVIRQVGASFGIAVFTTIMQGRQAIHYAASIGAINTSSPDFLFLQTAYNGIAHSMGMGYTETQVLTYGTIIKLIAKLSLMKAIGDCFLIAAALCLLAMILTLFFRDRKREPVRSGQVIEKTTA